METRLTTAQERVLYAACHYKTQGQSGVAIRGAQIKSARALEAAGLLRFVAWGLMEDDPVIGAQRRIFAPTSKGKRLIARLAREYRSCR